MTRLRRRSRKVVGLTLIGVALLGGTATVRWGLPRLLPDLTARASDAYSRGDWDQAALLARQRLKQAPDDGAAWRLAARAAARQDRDESAIGLYSRLIVEVMEAEDFFLLGRALSRTGRVDAAFKSYETARERNPDHPETLDALGQLYQQNDRSYAAQDVAERLARQPGWEARGLLMLGAARAELEDPAGAAEALQRAFRLDPEGRAAAPAPVDPLRKLLVRSLLKSQQTADARQVLQSILRSGPDLEASWLLSRSLIQGRDWDRAAALLPQVASYRAEHLLEFEAAPYVGATRCAGCHRPESAALGASRHAITFNRAQDLGKLPLPQGPLPDPGNPQVTHHLQRVNDSLHVETRTSNRVLRAVVHYAFGSTDHFTTFVGRDDRGRSVMIRISHYESPRGSGWDLSTGLPAHPARDDEYLGDPMLEGDGVRRCLYCHTTNFRAVLDRVGPEAADHSIGCERCHGPGGHHVAAVEAGLSDLAIANPGAASADEVNRLCGQCHNIHRPEILSAPRTDPVWNRFQALALTWSRCYIESPGKLSCTTCHDPHRVVESSSARAETKCLSCHGPDPQGARAAPATISADATRTDPLTRSGQKVVEGRVRGNASAPNAAREEPSPKKERTTCPVNPAKGCLECHMPRAWQQSTHTFKTDHFIRVHDRTPPEG